MIHEKAVIVHEICPFVDIFDSWPTEKLDILKWFTHQSFVEVDGKSSHKQRIACSSCSSDTSFRDSPRCNKMSDADCKTSLKAW